MSSALRFVLISLALGVVASIDNGKGVKPPMGWRSWNLYGANVNQQLMMDQMDGMVARDLSVDGVLTSLSDLGYNDVGLDDNWQECGTYGVSLNPQFSLNIGTLELLQEVTNSRITTKRASPWSTRSSSRTLSR